MIFHYAFSSHDLMRDFALKKICRDAIGFVARAGVVIGAEMCDE